MSEQNTVTPGPTPTPKHDGHAVNPDRYTDFLNTNEHILLESRQHPIMLLAAILKGLVVIAICAALYFLVNDKMDNNVGHILRWVVLVPILLVLPGVLWSILGWSRSRLAVTTEKVLFVHGILNKQVETTPLVKIEEMTVEQPVFGRMFKYGKLLVDDPSGGKKALYDLHYLVDPAKAYRLITETARQNRAYEGGANAAEFPHR
ncbi:MAG: PH domain-containing protein [Thermoleophilia bacterium]|nr:PH domain-containing protein [Thermoleophilia bacterium]